MPGRKSRSKGVRRELEFAALIPGARRVPLSGQGQTGTEFADDVVIPYGGGALRCQVKSKANGWVRLYADMGGADVLALKADRQPWLVVLPVERFVELMQAKEAQSGG